MADFKIAVRGDRIAVLVESVSDGVATGTVVGVGDGVVRRAGVKDKLDKDGKPVLDATGSLVKEVIQEVRVDMRVFMEDTVRFSADKGREMKVKYATTPSLPQEKSFVLVSQEDVLA